MGIKISTKSMGLCAVKCNIDFLLTYYNTILYASFYDFKTVIDKINSDIQALKTVTYAVEENNREYKIEMEPVIENRRIFKQSYKETKRVHLTLTTHNENILFYKDSEDIIPQIKGFLIKKHRLLLSDNDLMEVVERYGKKARVWGHNDIGLRALVFDISKIKREFLINDPSFLDHINNSIDFIKENSSQFREALAKNVKVLYDKDKTYNIEKYFIKPLPGQEVLWGAGIEVLKKENFLYLAADMGLGKTLSSLFINDQVQTDHRKKQYYTTLIVAPTTTMRGKDGGWFKEIKDTMTTAEGVVRPHETIIITSEEGYKEFIKTVNRIDFKNPDKNYFIVVSKEALKFSYNLEPQYNIKNYIKTGKGEIVKRKVVCCPDCGKPMRYGKDEILMREEQFFTDKLTIKNRIEDNKKCNHCGTQLFGAYSNRHKEIQIRTYNYNEKQMEILEELNDSLIKKRKQTKIGLHKISVMDYIEARKIKFDGIIIDEVHQGNKIGSLISKAQATVLKYGKKKIVLSGTSNAGYASNMYSILRATMSRKLSEKGLTGKGFMKRFVTKYGILERVFKEEYGTRGKSEKKVNEVEKEGISSELFTDFLAENYIFFTYKDIRKKMESIVEEYVKVDQNEYVEDQANDLTERMTDVNVAQYGMLKDSILKHLVNHPVSDWGGAIEMQLPFSKETEMVPIPIMNEELAFRIEGNSKITPKDEKMIEIIEQEIRENRKVCIFSYFTGTDGSKKYMQGEPVTDRIRVLLEEKGFRVAQLTRDKLMINGKNIKTNGGERQVRLHEEQENYDILITNPKIVNVGINLRFIPTYINYMPSYDVSEVSQANRRGYRINTEVENRIYHLYYENTVEKEIIERFQTKRLESKAMEGVFDVNIESEKEEKLRSHSKSVNKLVKELEDSMIS